MSADVRRARRIPILTYHSLDDSGSVLSVPPFTFMEHLRLLREMGVETITLRDVINRDIPEKAVVITFDDGFESVYYRALPALLQCGFTATVFLVTDYCQRTNSWPSQPAREVRRPLLQWRQVKEMSDAGICFGAHTKTHPDLTRIPTHEAEEEIRGSKEMIENVVQRPVDSFAYPYGVYDAAVKRLVAAHFKAACSTVLGFATPRSDHLALERLDMYYLRHPAVFRHLFSSQLAVYVRLRRLARALRRVPYAPSYATRRAPA